jgi:arabinofuranosyltransferase
MTPRLLIGVGFVLLIVALVSSAWVCDDAWITFRTVKRFWEGDGLTWNPGERVQAYTHPLWMLLMLVFAGVTKEFFFTSIALSFALTLGFAGWLTWILRTRASLAAAVPLVLVASRAFVDFSVSGLENPLQSVLLLALIAAVLSRREGMATLVLSALFLTRADSVLIAAPLWLAMHWGQRPTWWAMALGALPAIGWELFSYAYYGAWVPNTAIAKLNLEVGWGTLISSGLRYLGDSFSRDPVTLVVMIAALGFAFRRGDRFARALALGAVLSLLYVIRIGGDFMSGRFLVAPFVASLGAAAMVLRTMPSDLRLERGLLVGLAAYALLWPLAPLRTGTHFGEGYREAVELDGVVDERAYYFPWVGLVPVLRSQRDLVPPYSGACRGRELAQSALPGQLAGETGMFGFFAGDKVVIDLFTLADPLLARIPYRTTSFRAGHYSRPMPAGYLETRLSRDNRLEDPGLRAAWDDLQLVTRGPLFTAERFAAIRRVNGDAHRESFLRASQQARTPLPLPPPSACDDW